MDTIGPDEEIDHMFPSPGGGIRLRARLSQGKSSLRFSTKFVPFPKESGDGFGIPEGERVDHFTDAGDCGRWRSTMTEREAMEIIDGQNRLSGGDRLSYHSAVSHLSDPETASPISLTPHHFGRRGEVPVACYYDTPKSGNFISRFDGGQCQADKIGHGRRIEQKKYDELNAPLHRSGLIMKQQQAALTANHRGGTEFFKNNSNASRITSTPIKRREDQHVFGLNGGGLNGGGLNGGGLNGGGLNGGEPGCSRVGKDAARENFPASPHLSDFHSEVVQGAKLPGGGWKPEYVPPRKHEFPKLQEIQDKLMAAVNKSASKPRRRDTIEKELRVLPRLDLKSAYEWSPEKR